METLYEDSRLNGMYIISELEPDDGGGSNWLEEVAEGVSGSLFSQTTSWSINMHSLSRSSEKCHVSCLVTLLTPNDVRLW
jgi:hypothetical protein